ncbi:MAG: IDEAL domain-containing protein [Bacillus sp. (in: Bacteria)]|nr:IDEAL domain-containing protein [Bacillus sp. (in: firmicutes)]
MVGKEFEKGEWVRGRLREGELIHGYVESVNPELEINKVTVIKSDNDQLIGKVIWIGDNFVEKLPTVPANSETELLSLIDIALLNKDEQWFMDLSEQLSSIKKLSIDKKKKTDLLISGNRFENSDSKQ